MPRQQFGGEYLHADIPAMAAAYAFHISGNHPFVDGNKRAATAAMIAFLSDNGWSFDAQVDDAEQAILRLASGHFEKADFTQWVRGVIHEKPRMELRQFFAFLTLERLGQHFNARLRDPVTGQLPSEHEAATHIPAVTELLDMTKAAVASNDRESADAFVPPLTLLVALYRIAEDLGYEW